MEGRDYNYIENRNCIRGVSELTDSSIDLVLTAPPNYDSSESETLEEYLGTMRAVFYLCYTKLKQGKFIAINIENITIEKGVRIPLQNHITNLMLDLGFEYKEDIIYEKSKGTSLQVEGVRHSVNHEYILVFQKPGSKSDEYNTQESNVWKMSTVGKVSGITPFPIELSDKVIGRYSVKGDVVLDPFIGSGTTALSSIKSGRKYIGYEINEEVYLISKKVINNFKQTMTN